MTGFLSITNLTGTEYLILVCIVTVAGVVRGFSGFALSALVMSTAVLILPPVELIPICWFLEMAASAVMFRGGWKVADHRIVWGLIGTSIIGVPVGIAILKAVSIDASKLIVLVMVIVLATLQLAKVRIAFLGTRPGLYLAGFVSGIATGLASVGGMVVALYVLSQDAPAAKMRAALVMYLFISLLTSVITYLITGIMTGEAAARGLSLALFAAAGVFLGQKLFTPRLTPYYRTFCLTLLVSLATFGVVRTQLF